MTPFSGWDMPLHYGSQIAEHETVRSSAGMFDVSHMCPADFSGADATQALQKLLANDVAKLKPLQALYTAMLNEQGGIIDDLIVYRLHTDDHIPHYRIVHNAGRADEDIAWITMQIDAHGWNIHYTPRRDLAMIAIQGPNARALACNISSVVDIAKSLMALSPFYAFQAGDSLYARTGYTGEDGFEWMIPTDVAENIWQALIGVGVKPCGLGARDTLRLEAGMSLYGQDLDTVHTPMESGIGWTVSMKDTRDFIGRAVLASQVPRLHTLGLRLEGGGVLRPHQKIRTPAGEGEITSGGFSPTLKISIALARLPLTTKIGDCVEVNIRDKWLSATVCKAQFVRLGHAV